MRRTTSRKKRNNCRENLVLSLPQSTDSLREARTAELARELAEEDREYDPDLDGDVWQFLPLE